MGNPPLALGVALFWFVWVCLCSIPHHLVVFPFLSMMTWALRPHGVRTRGKKSRVPRMEVSQNFVGALLDELPLLDTQYPGTTRVKGMMQIREVCARRKLVLYSQFASDHP